MLESAVVGTLENLVVEIAKKNAKSKGVQIKEELNKESQDDNMEVELGWIGTDAEVDDLMIQVALIEELASNKKNQSG